jgi:hypothetical protein
MYEQVRDSYRMSTVTAHPFAFDNLSLDRPTELGATFIAEDGVCYAYGFSVLNGRVVDEWAERYTTARPTLLFERKGDAVRFGAALRGPNRAVQNTMRPSSLYLSAASAAGHQGLAPLYEWFLTQFMLFGAHGHGPFLTYVVATLAKDADLRDRLVAMLSRADLGVRGLEMETYEFTDSEKAQFQQVREIVRAFGDKEVSLDMPSQMYQAFVTHFNGAQSYRLALEEESDGTRAMLCHAFVIEEALRSGATIVFDEIDASLHPLLVRELVKAFQDPALNPRQAQLIFTTHDVSLMEAGYLSGAQLSRDEIWLTEKNDAGRSNLVAVADFGPRTRENLARRYLAGRFGGVPSYLALVDPVLT